MAVTEEPILSRLDRVDNMVRQLEEIRGSTRSTKSSAASYASTPNSSSELGQSSSFDNLSLSLEKNCLPINRVMLDPEIKGTLVQRIDQLEQRLLKVEGELENEKKREEISIHNNEKSSGKKKGLKGLVNKMVKGSKDKHNFKD